MIKISTSILGIKDNLEENILKLNNTSTDYIHLDIMDGKFVKHKSFEFNTIERISKIINKPLDIHFMVEAPYEYINKYKIFNPKYITIHCEINNVKKYIEQIKQNNIKVGVSIKPNTDISNILPLLNEIDLILIMSVEPGEGGQKFIENSINKIKLIKEYILENNLDTKIEIDGGINDINSKICINSGADILVSGSYITQNDNYESQIQKLKI